MYDSISISIAYQAPKQSKTNVPSALDVPTPCLFDVGAASIPCEAIGDLKDVCTRLLSRGHPRDSSGPVPRILMRISPRGIDEIGLHRVLEGDGPRGVAILLHFWFSRPSLQKAENGRFPPQDLQPCEGNPLSAP